MNKEVKKMEVVGKEVAKITTSDLRDLQTVVGGLNENKMKLGDLQLNYEIQKSQILNEVMKIEEELKKLQERLKENYGDVQIDIQTGVINPPQV